MSTPIGFLPAHALFLFLWVFLDGIDGAFAIRPGTASHPAALRGGLAGVAYRARNQASPEIWSGG
jgi:hypothetical protein